MGTAPANAREALDMIRAGLGYLAAADTASLGAATQAGCLRELEQAGAVLTAVRAFVLAGFTAGQGYADDAGYSAVSWLIHQTHITRGAAVGHTAWAKRTGTHPEVLAALAAEMYERARGDLPDQDPDRDFADRGVKLATTFGGAGVVHGDLTPECAELVGRVLDALGAPAGKEDNRSQEERYHDALQEAMR